jgi:Bacterial pre-peptidase C-terminal domain
MNRLTSGLVSSLALLLTAACSTEPTNDLSNSGAADRLVAKPSQFTAEVGVTKKVIVGALDAQGNQLNFTYEIGTVGAGLVVERDFSYLPIFTGADPSPIPPKSAAEFQYLVTATSLGATSFSITAGGKEVVVPVIPVPNPLAPPPVVTVSSTGPNASDPTVLTAPAPLRFSPGATVTFDAGDAILVEEAEDGSTITIFPPPATTSTGAVNGLVPSYAPDLTPAAAVTNVALTINPSVPSQPGTDNPATAPDIGTANAFFDGGAFTGADITADGGVGAQYYQFTLTEDADVAIEVNWEGDADVDIVLCSDVACADGGADGGGISTAQPEVSEHSLTAGTYYIAVVLFAQGGSALNPAWVSLSIQ